MAWDGEHGYKKREEYSDSEWAAVSHKDKMATKQYWGTEQNLKGAQGGNKEWMDYQAGGGDQVRLWEDMGKGERRDYKAEHGKGSKKKYAQENAGNFWTNHDPENPTDYSQEAFMEGLEDKPWQKEQYESGKWDYNDIHGNSRSNANDYQTKQQEALERANQHAGNTDTEPDEPDTGTDPDPDPGTDPTPDPVDPEVEEQEKHAEFSQGVVDRANANAGSYHVNTAAVRAKGDARIQNMWDRATMQGVKVWGDRDHSNASRPSFVMPESPDPVDAPDFQSMYDQVMEQLKGYKI